MQSTGKDGCLGREKVPISPMISIKYIKVKTVIREEEDLKPLPSGRVCQNHVSSHFFCICHCISFKSCRALLLDSISSTTSNTDCIDLVSSIKITELRSGFDLCHWNTYQFTLPGCSDVYSLNNKKSGKHMPQLLCHKAILVNSSLALMPVCLKAFTVNPGSAVNRRL